MVLFWQFWFLSNVWWVFVMCSSLCIVRFFSHHSVNPSSCQSLVVNRGWDVSARDWCLGVPCPPTPSSRTQTWVERWDRGPAAPNPITQGFSWAPSVLAPNLEPPELLLWLSTKPFASPAWVQILTQHLLVPWLWESCVTLSLIHKVRMIVVFISKDYCEY